MPVRGGAREQLRGDGAVGAGPVLRHDRLANRLAHPRRDHARDDVGRPAGDEGNEDGDGALRPFPLGARGERQGEAKWRQNRRGERGAAGNHRRSSTGLVVAPC